MGKKEESVFCPRRAKRKGRPCFWAGGGGGAEGKKKSRPPGGGGREHYFRTFSRDWKGPYAMPQIRGADQGGDIS